jgi:enoyl-CoA hydratase/carnithine racemase
MPAMDGVLCEVESGVARITIDRPERRNALDPEVLGALRRVLRQAGDDPAVRVVTLTGGGDRIFCAGADLKASLGAPGRGPADFGRAEYRALLVDLAGCPKPTVALARGHVLAGGLGLLLACDLALACDDVEFATPEIHVGMFPMMVLALLLRHVGRKHALELALLGERISAAEAREYGIVNRIFPRAEFETAAAGFVARLAAKSSHILRLGKEALGRVEGRPLAEQLERLEDALEAVMASEDSREGIRAFVEKRPPRWRDR